MRDFFTLSFKKVKLVNHFSGLMFAYFITPSAYFYTIFFNLFLLHIVNFLNHFINISLQSLFFGLSILT